MNEKDFRGELNSPSVSTGPSSKTLLENMSVIDVLFVEEAKYPEKKHTRLSKIRSIAACLAIVLAVGAFTYASGAIDALRSYFSTQDETLSSMLKEGTLSVSDENMEMRVDNYIADEDSFVFTVSLLGTDQKFKTNDTFKTAWITNDGEKIAQYDKTIGAYTEGSGWGDAFVAHAKSMYDDADATFIVINYMPEGYSIEDLKSVEVCCKNLSLDVEVGDSIIESYRLFPKDSGSNESDAEPSLTGKDGATDNLGSVVTDFRASSIGFSFICNVDSPHICIIKADGTHLEDDGKTETDGYHGFFGGGGLISRNGDKARYSYHGHWGGEGGISIGILDLDKYAGISVDGVDYYFER